MDYPKISIITPSYNQGQFLEETMLSVLNQNYPNLEYIVIDGGSTDNSVEIIKKYEKRLKYWVSEKDGGQTDAINKGLRRSNGEIIGWLNSDDTYVPGAFFHVAKAFSAHRECVLVHGNRILIDAQSRVIGWTVLPPFNPQKGGFTVCSETAFWRREASERAGELKTEIHFAMDLEFFCRLYQPGKFHKSDRFLGCFRCHENNKSSTIAEVGVKEGEREWKRFFGSDNENWKLKPPAYMGAHIMALVKHPLLITRPYLAWRFFRGRETGL